MARQPRFTPPGYAQHVVHRGNNRHHIFHVDADRSLYLRWLASYAERHEVAIHAWVLMSNHVHLLVTPSRDDSLALLMQSIGRKYVCYFNRRYARTGTLFEGRYRSSLVTGNSYLLACYRYIEMNPVRARMVKRPQDYPWSSHGSNAYGRSLPWLRPHPTYLELGSTCDRRCRAYRALFATRTSPRANQQIRDALNKGLAVGDEASKQALESEFGCRLTAGRQGRPALPKN